MTAVVTGSTQLLGVIGCPIEHSLSPVMHNAALAALADTSLPYIYVPMHIEPTDLKQAIQGLACVGCRGFNITIPHKQAIIPLLCDVSATAKAVGAVNTVWRTEQGWAGTNTDVQGFLSPLLSLSRDWSQSAVTVLGSGGAARAVIAACHQLNCAHIHVCGRNAAKLEQLQADFAHASVAIHTHLWDSLSGLMPETTLLVNTTPVGMHPQRHQSPLTMDQLKQLSGDAIAYDLIYTPNPTQFLQDAEALGCHTISGLEMLVQQGAAALEIWLGQPAPIDVMRETLQAQLP
ncbi:Shikimate dehydrogenase (NADP(+)) [Acaryochloris thomasi RCC1774]|uniref:Shikimate dehydrogenase (NADP(+)) n=1 Tax=Acaryochloris thomasi RCC1774 TaxID=1764569 RepID=A0A2W1JB03_9CYAN|nr:shikimate dehydrogenase [Acaryochloris thomasi]PZD71273.1 Shikimate dehydrogenase (NADP(+)) [Acaryochloris thomasi RCC1774]